MITPEDCAVWILRGQPAQDIRVNGWGYNVCKEHPGCVVIPFIDIVRNVHLNNSTNFKGQVSTDYGIRDVEAFFDPK